MTKKQDALNKAKESGKKVVEGGKEFGTGTIQAVRRTIGALKGGAKAVGHVAKGGYHLIDAGDKAIGEQIEKKQLEKGKRPGKIGRFFRDNIIKLMIVLGATGYGGYKTAEIVKDKQQDKQEIVIGEGSKANKHTYQLSFEEREYFQDPEFFDTGFSPMVDETYKNKGIELIRDAGMTFYVVQDGETKKEQIREKLSSIPEFSYLEDSVYMDKIKGFNVPDTSLKKGLYIPIPVQSADRKIDINQFREYSEIALDEMKNNPHYGEKVKKIIKEVGKKRVVDIMIAFARCETSMDQETFADPIGTGELHRWEPKYQSFSFSYYHVLMEKNADGKTPGPGLRARQNLGLTEGQCYHPINAGKLFLGYCFEKVKSDPTYFFKIRNLAEAKEKGGKYNGDPSYGQKLRDNIEYISKK